MSLPGHDHIGSDGFRLRGIEFARLDAFSDVVFGFALTLLVVSLEVPKTFPELEETLRGFFPFFVSFFLLMIIWYSHYRYFRRFATHDLGTICINSLLLFVVLFYVYPLKFLFNFVVLGMMGHWHQPFSDVRQLTHLMVIYGVGFAAIYLLIAALYMNGYRQRLYLQLTTLELLLTRYYIFEAAATAGISLLSCAFALLLRPIDAGYAGLIYILIWPMKTIAGTKCRREALALLSTSNAPATVTVDTEPV